MSVKRIVLDFLVKEWMLFISAFGVVITSFFLHRAPKFSNDEYQVIFLLFVFFVAVKGIEQSGLLFRFSQSIEGGRFIAFKLTLATFLISMFVTNDVALIIIVPLTMMLNVGRKGTLVILEALAANAGSALTPFGNPQNLFIYWHYGVGPEKFIYTIVPFSGFFLIILVVGALFLSEDSSSRFPTIERIKVKFSAWVYGAFLILLILVVLHVFPIYVGFIVLAYALVFDRDSLGVDYLLLLTFISFFGLANNLKSLIPFNIGNSGQTFLFSALASQVISNVPATLLFSKYSSQWEALLWGSNVGGFGSLVASMANLIAYKIYLNKTVEKDRIFSFTIKFMGFGYLAFLLGIGLYFLLYS